jgi:hypothetical protein
MLLLTGFPKKVLHLVHTVGSVEIAAVELDWVGELLWFDSEELS